MSGDLDDPSGCFFDSLRSWSMTNILNDMSGVGGFPIRLGDGFGDFQSRFLFMGVRQTLVIFLN